jgi:hypothetical protein
MTVQLQLGEGRQHLRQRPTADRRQGFTAVRRRMQQVEQRVLEAPGRTRLVR